MSANSEDVVFISTKKSKGTYIVRQNVSITVEEKIGNTNKTTKKRKVLRYIDGVDSIFVDEQKAIFGDNVPDTTPVYIIKGKKKVESDKVNLIQYLRIHPDNVANGGRDFKEFDEAKEDKLEVERFKRTSEIGAKIMGVNDILARALGVWFLNINHLTKDPAKTKKAIYMKCHQDFEFAQEVEKFIDSEGGEEKLTATIALKEEIVKIIDGTTIAWSNSDEPIFRGSQANDVIKEFSDWLTQDETGRSVLKVIAEKIKKIPKK